LSSFSPIVYALFGLLTGGLLNLLADRLPRREPPGAPICHACDRPRPWVGWLATAHYLLTQGRCTHCGARISPRHPLTEIVTAALFATLWCQHGPSLRLFFESLYTAILILLFVIDLEHRLVLHVTTLPAILLALGGSFFLSREGYNWRLALLGGATGFLLVWAMYLFGHLFVRALERRRGVEINEVAFGFGDVTLTTLIGLIVGFPTVVFALALGVVLGGVGGAVYWLIQAVVRRRYTAFTAIPYGPFLIVAGWIFMVWGYDFFQWYAGS
jgi:leader peptidase (prepilin peptidase)/N-methyltransferase